MAARKRKNTVNYFPHLIQDGKTMFIIESKYKNDGYATWYKILERLGKSENHFINLSDTKELMYLASKCNIENELLKLIIDDLSDLGKFDKTLWREYTIIWSQDFVDNIADVYKRRDAEMPTTKLICQQLNIKYKQSKLNNDNGQQSIVKDIKEKERKGKKKTCETSSLHTILKNDFFLWYEHLKKTKYDWSAKDGKHLSLLIPKIKRKITEAEIELTDENIQKNFRVFLKGIKEKWILDNFTIPIINSKFNEIFTKAKTDGGGGFQDLNAEIDKRFAESEQAPGQ